MNKEIDHADNEVKGLERYIPSLLSKTLLLGSVPAAASTYLYVLSNTEKFLITSTALEKHLLALSFSLAILSLFWLALVINQMVIIYQAKHSRIKYFSLEHPQMSFRWLFQNANFKHYLLLTVIFVAGLYLGYAVSNL